MRDHFPYVEVTYAAPGRRFEKWRRVRYDRLGEVLAESHAYNTFATLQRYASAEPTGQPGQEPHWSDLLFDLDGEGALEDARRVVAFFHSLGLGPEAIRVYFSGRRGFHVLIDGQALGARPSPTLHQVYRLAASEVARLLGLTTFDESIYSRRRVIRVVGTVHPQSGLFKIELTLDQLQRWDMEQIKDAARSPTPDRPWEDNSPHPVAAAWLQRFVEVHEALGELKRKSEGHALKAGVMPECVADLLTTHIRLPGTRNRATMALAIWLKLSGVPEEQVGEQLVEWALRTPPELTSTPKAQIPANTLSVVHAVYSGDYYFSCAFMRSLGSAERPIRCHFDACPALKEELRPQPVPLARASDPEHYGRPILCSVLVAGKDASPYVVPSVLNAYCLGDGTAKACANCRMPAVGQRYELRIDERSPLLLRLVDVPDAMLRAALKEALGVPSSCRGLRYEVLQRTLVEEVKLVPKREATYEDEEHVVRRGFYVTTRGLATNQEYELVAYPWHHPRNQRSVLVFAEARSTASSLDVEWTEERLDALRLFQAGDSPEEIQAKLEEIHADLELNVTRIWKRRDVLCALDLTYHSVLGFWFQGEVVPRGWLQLLILGDTRQGKTQIVERLMKHYRLGQKVSGESASRTGLVYNLQETGGRWFLTWGTVPLNDRRLVIIDEFAGLPEEEIALLSDLRSTGVAEVQRVISAKANARTRLVFVSNPRSGYPLSQYAFGIQAVRELMGKAEDIARLDLVATAPAGDVSLEEINAPLSSHEPVPHRYTSDLCHLLVLWAWTRRPEQVRFEEEAEALVLQLAGMARSYECDIPLVEGAEMRIKLARVAAAIAARLFSTPDGQELVVKPGHVVAAAEFIERLLRAPGLRLDLYARTQTGAQADIDRALEEFADFPDLESLVPVITFNEYFTVSGLGDQLNWERDECRQLLSWMVKSRLVKQTRNGYRKTAAGHVFAHRLMGLGVEALKQRRKQREF